MEELIPLVLLGLGWLFIGLPVSLAKKKQAEQEAAARRKKAAAQAAQTSQEASAPAAPSAPQPAGIPVYESRLAPSISLTRSDDSVYQGSLNAFTGEGYDPCHEDQLQPRPADTAMEIPVSDPVRLPFGWTGSDVVRGIVVSEILNRKKAV